MARGVELALLLFLLPGVLAAVLILAGYPIYVIANKLETGPSWFAFVPVLSVCLLAGLASDSRNALAGRGFLLQLVLTIPYLNLFALACVWANISVNTGRSAFWGFATIVPGLNFVLYWVIAWRALPRREPAGEALPANP